MIETHPLYESYARFIRDIGGTPLSYDRWLSANQAWAMQKPGTSDIEFDQAKERDGDAQ